MGVGDVSSQWSDSRWRSLKVKMLFKFSWNADLLIIASYYWLHMFFPLGSMG